MSDSKTTQMKEPVDHHSEVVSALNRDTLWPVVREVLSRPESEVVDWQCHRVKGGLGGGLLVRITGTANDGVDQLNWSVFLKVLKRETEPDKMNFSRDGWKREILAYQSGIFDDLKGGMEAAVCYQIEAKSETEIWLWLEDLSGEANAPWSLDRYGLAARHLGQLNGFYLSEPALPAFGWQLDAFDRRILARDGDIEKFCRVKDDPLIQRVMPPERHSMIFHLWENRETYLAKLYDRLPQTFGHMDGGRYNLFSRDDPYGQPSTIAIDWAHIGTAPIGKEMKPLALHSAAFGHIELELARELDQTVFGGYIDGLRDMGWNGDPRWARYGCTMLVAMHILRALPSRERLLDTSDEVLERQAAVGAFVMELAAEGLELDKVLF